MIEFEDLLIYSVTTRQRRKEIQAGAELGKSVTLQYHVNTVNKGSLARERVRMVRFGISICDHLDTSLLSI